MRNIFAAISPAVLFLMIGCSTSAVTDPGKTVSPLAVAGNGSVHGGQQAVIGATVQLWQVGTTGYGAGAAALGTSTLSQADGSFSITNLYHCSDAASGDNTLVYITATGGNPGSGFGPNNQLLMMAALGRCGNLTPATFISINEVTTVAAVYALAQFMSPSGNIGSYGYSSTGLTNAFATVNSLVNVTTGLARATTPNGNGVVPQAELNTLANTMAFCINSSSVAGSPSAACASYFLASTPGAG